MKRDFSEFGYTHSHFPGARTAGAVFLILIPWIGRGIVGRDAPQEEGEFRILVGGKEIGSERYALAVTGQSASSTSILHFRNPATSGQKVHMESRLDMDGQFRPRTYRLTSSIDGKKGSVVGNFSANQVIFEYEGGSSPVKKGLLVGADITVLDTNLFHHFVFLVRLFKFDSKEKMQRFEVVIPQEADSGVLKITEMNRESLVLNGRKIETRHLQVDSGALIIHLWVDKQRVVQKISVPSSNIEVVRAS